MSLSSDDTTSISSSVEEDSVSDSEAEVVRGVSMNGLRLAPVRRLPPRKVGGDVPKISISLIAIIPSLHSLRVRLKSQLPY